MKKNNKLAHYLPKVTAQTILDVFAKGIPSQTKIEIYLFGSYAKGQARPPSDIDIALKGDGPLPLTLWSRLEEAFQESDIPQKVDLVDFHRAVPSFQQVILEQGILLWKSQ